MVQALVLTGGFTAAAVTAVLCGLVWRQRDQPGARSYAFLLATIVAWILLYVVALATPDLATNQLLYSLAFTFELSATVFWLVFALAYTGRRTLLPRWASPVLAVFPLTTAALAVTNDAHGLVWSGYSVATTAGLSAPSFAFGPWFLLAVAFGFGLVGFGLVLLLEFTLGDTLYGDQTIALAFGACLPAVTSLKFLFGVGPLAAVDLTPLAFAITAPVLGYALLRGDLFERAPATKRVGQQAALDDFGDGVLITDRAGRIVDVNDAAASLLALPEQDPVGEPLDDVFDREAFDLSSPPETVRLETSQGRREYDLTVSPVTDDDGTVLGHTVVLHDVTDEKRRRQRLEVLNRVLRHNLRNSMNAVLGYTEHVEQFTDEEGTEFLERIERQSDDLVAISEKAREVDRVTDPSRERTEFSLRGVLQTVSEQLEADVDGLSTTVHIPGDLRMTSSQPVVSQVVYYGARTLLAHNDSDQKRLVLSATPTDTPRPWVAITVTDNGGGIPPQEQSVIRSGSETPLQHNEDIDLWLVTWGAEAIGGDLSFIDDGDRPGLRLSLPDFDEASAGLTENGTTP